jgi:Domain of unknown function (DUF1707)
MTVSSIDTLKPMTAPPSSPDSPGLRASDAEREHVAEALRRHHLDGRIDTEELAERLDRCYAARTTAELQPLLADLPADEREWRRAPRRATAWPPLLVVAIAALLVAATAGAIAHGHPGPLPFIAVFLLLRFAWLRSWPRRRRTAWSPRV